MSHPTATTRAVPVIPVLNPSPFQRPSTTRRMIRTVVTEFANEISTKSDVQLGYPLIPNVLDDGVDLDLADALSDTLLNNVGDPSLPAIFSMNTHPFELGVLEFFAHTWNLPYEDAWGYVTSSSTEAILQAMYTARENHGPTGVVYVSAHAHYSSKKAAKILGLACVEIDTDFLGRMDYADLRAKIDPTRPAFVIATVGTTMTGAIDDVDTISEILDDLGVASYVHVDAALTGSLLPFVAGYEHVVSFRGRVDSISTSGHKFLGTTMPCGVFIVREPFMDVFREDVAYVHTKDRTIPCSRNGHAIIQAWTIISQLGVHGLKARASSAISTATAAVDKFVEAGIQSYLLNGSTTIVIQAPDPAVVKKYQLATSQGFAHLVIMPTTQLETIEMLIFDIKTSL